MSWRVIMRLRFARRWRRGRACLWAVARAVTLVVLGPTDGSTSCASREWRRLLLHVPAGYFNALLFGWRSSAGVCFFLAFLVYEVWQGYCLRDFGYRDVRGWLWGFVLAVVVGFFT